jgi:hypothetical protein
MAGKYGASSFSVLLIDGRNLLAAKVKNFTHKIISLMEPSHGLGDGWEASSPVGLQRAELTQDGAFFDDTTNGIHETMKASENVSRILCFAFAGNIIGRSFVGIEGTYGMAYDVLGQRGALTKANVAYQVSGQVDRGQIIQDHATKVASWNTKSLGTQVDYSTDPAQTVIPITSSSVANPSTITTPVSHGLVTGQRIVISGHAGSTPAINGQQTVTVVNATQFTIPVNVTVGGTGGSFVRGSTANGGVAYLQVSDMTGFTGFVGKVRSSADDITYADLATFTNVAAAPAAQRVTVNGTIDRYLSFDGAPTGSGSITAFCGFARA